MRDSNPRKRSQSPVCYRYTNPLYVCLIIIPVFPKKSRGNGNICDFLQSFLKYHSGIEKREIYVII